MQLTAKVYKIRTPVKPNEILRDEWLAYMTFGHVERPFFVELFGPLIGLEDEWRAQGASAQESSLEAFGFHYLRRHHVQVSTGMLGGLPERMIEEPDDYLIRQDRYGRRIKLCKGKATIPLPLDYPVSDMDSWLRLKPYYEFSEKRFAEGWLERAKAARDDGALICVGIPGGFDEVRQLLGEEELCIAYYEQPELIHDILETIGSTAEQVLDRVSREVGVDHLSVHEDMAGKSGSLVGPNVISEFIAPYYLRVWNMLRSRGAKIFQQDSDGNMDAVIPAFLEAGLNCMFPMEPAAGMDIVKVRNLYGNKLALMGGIDKHVLRQSKEAIRKELEYKLQPSMRKGGAVFGLDHRIPNGTPLENYRYYVKTARVILGLDPTPAAGWMRMAF
ncbi:MAG: hypothetical protein JXR97_09105 [Planctomycetes bacterium]|nr:hypothetical protein [Planctomycetota bacterium]